MTLTSLGSDYVTNSVNRFFPMNGKVTVNVTLEFVSNQFTRATVVKRDIQRKLIEVIQVRKRRLSIMKTFLILRSSIGTFVACL